MRFGYYRDYSITSSVIEMAVQRPAQSSQPHREIVFNSSTSTKQLDAGRDLESGNVSKNEGKVDELVEDVSFSRDSKVDIDQSEKTDV
jgi:hypothetical protein